MALTRQVTIEFVGGPLDGFQQPVPPPTADCNLLALPINVNVLRIVSGGTAGEKRKASSVAIYESTSSGRSYVYRFVGPAPVEALKLESWLG